MTNKQTAICAAVFGSLLLAGCGREEEAKPEEPKYDTPYARMHDPAYLKAIDEKRAEQKTIMREMMAARQEIAAFKAAHPGEEVPADLQRKLLDAAEKMEKNRILSQMLVRDRIQQENAAVENRKQQEDLKKGE